MLHKQRSTVFSLAVLFLLVGLLAGCGGSGGGESGSQEGAENGGGGGDGAAEKAKKAPESKMALGEIISVKADREKVVLRPPEEAQGGERMIFRVRKNAKITLGDKKAEIADIKKGQQAQIEYVVNKEKNNRATTIKLFEGGGGEG